MGSNTRMGWSALKAQYETAVQQKPKCMPVVSWNPTRDTQIGSAAHYQWVKRPMEVIQVKVVQQNEASVIWNSIVQM